MDRLDRLNFMAEDTVLYTIEKLFQSKFGGDHIIPARVHVVHGSASHHSCTQVVEAHDLGSRSFDVAVVSE